MILNVTLTLRRREGAEATCGYCREAVAEALACPGCEALYHPDCAGELGRCGSPGCRRELLRRAPEPRPPRRAERPSRRGRPRRATGAWATVRRWVEHAQVAFGVVALLVVPPLVLYERYVGEPRRQAEAEARQEAHTRRTRAQVADEQRRALERAAVGRARDGSREANLYVTLLLVGGDARSPLRAEAEALGAELVAQRGGDVEAVRRMLLARYRAFGFLEADEGRRFRRSLDLVLPAPSYPVGPPLAAASD